jgi:hypothetical protein
MVPCQIHAINLKENIIQYKCQNLVVTDAQMHCPLGESISLLIPLLIAPSFETSKTTTENTHTI